MSHFRRVNVPLNVTHYGLWIVVHPKDGSAAITLNNVIQVHRNVVKLGTIRYLILKELQKANVSFERFLFMYPTRSASDSFTRVLPENENSIRFHDVVTHICDFDGQYTMHIECDDHVQNTNKSGGGGGGGAASQKRKRGKNTKPKTRTKKKTSKRPKKNHVQNTNKSGGGGGGAASQKRKRGKNSKPKTRTKKKTSKRPKKNDDGHKIARPYAYYNFVQRLKKHEMAVAKWIAEEYKNESWFGSEWYEESHERREVNYGTRFVHIVMAYVVFEEVDEKFEMTHREMYDKLDKMLNLIRKARGDVFLKYRRNREGKTRRITYQDTKTRTTYIHEHTYAPTYEAVQIFKMVCERYKNMFPDYETFIREGVGKTTSSEEEKEEEESKETEANKSTTNSPPMKFRKFKRQYMGVRVVHRKSAKKFAMHYQHPDKKNSIFKLFDDEVDAARAWDRAAVQTRGDKARLNFPVHDENTKYRGVELERAKNCCRPWRARFFIPNGGSAFIGTFADPVQAAKAYDAAVMKYYTMGLYKRKTYPLKDNIIAPLYLNFPSDYAEYMV